ncbi:MAG: class I SAM-dependent methyltransferase [Pseudomonadota bacterium]
MSFYEDKILPHVINCTCGSKPILRQRQKVVPFAEGRVLEIGIGTGLNLTYYDHTKVSHLIGLDPSQASWELAKQRAQALPFPVEFVAESAETIGLETDSIDSVVVTYSLCTIPDPVSALEGIRRVLKPRGQLLFTEHGRAPDEAVRRWQDRLDRVWGMIAGGCHLNRDIPRILELGGFQTESLETMYLPRTPRFAGFNFWGVAHKN